MGPQELMHVLFTPSALTPPEVTACELEVLGHWYGDTPELLEQAYGRYADDTAFLSVWWRDEVVAFGRFIRPGRHPLKTLSDVAKDPWGVDGERAATEAGVDLRRTWDGTTLGVRRLDRRTRDRMAPARTGLALFRAMFLMLRANDVRWLVMILDRTARRSMGMHGLRMTEIPGTGPREYMGSPACTPLLYDVDTTVASAAGRPLDGLVMPPREELLFPSGADR